MSNPFCIVLFVLLLGGCNSSMSEENMELRNKNTVHAYVETVWNSKDLEEIDSYYSEEFIRVVNGIEVATGNADLTANVSVLFVAFPDMHLKIEQISSCRNKVFLNWNIEGTNTGIFGDHIATGKKVRIGGMTRLDFNEDGKIIYDNVLYNELSLLQQLGYTLQKPNVE